MTFLETARLRFRTHEPEDEQDFIAMQTDPEVRRYVGGHAWPVEKAFYRFRHQFVGRPVKTYGLWATVFKDENRYIGYCGLSSHTCDGRRTVNLAYYLARPYWGRGLATEAGKGFIEVAFSKSSARDDPRRHREGKRCVGTHPAKARFPVCPQGGDSGPHLPHL